MYELIAYIDTVCCYGLVAEHCVVQLFHFLLRSIAQFYLNPETPNDTLSHKKTKTHLNDNSAVRECRWRDLVNMYAHVNVCVF